MAPVDMLATMDFRANPTRLLGGVQTMAKFQDYLIFCEFLDPKNRSGFWDLQLVLGVRRMLESNGFVNDETHGCFFKDEVDYPRWARRRNVGVFMMDFPTTACFQKFLMHNEAMRIHHDPNGLFDEEMRAAFQLFVDNVTKFTS